MTPPCNRSFLGYGGGINAGSTTIPTALGIANDLANGIIAKRIIGLARAGERHPGLH
jgi:hypothetical protein